MPAIEKLGDKKLYPLGGINTLLIIINKITDIIARFLLCIIYSNTLSLFKIITLRLSTISQFLVGSTFILSVS